MFFGVVQGFLKGAKVTIVVFHSSGASRCSSGVAGPAAFGWVASHCQKISAGIAALAVAREEALLFSTAFRLRSAADILSNACSQASQAISSPSSSSMGASSEAASAH